MGSPNIKGKFRTTCRNVHRIIWRKTTHSKKGSNRIPHSALTPPRLPACLVPMCRLRGNLENPNVIGQCQWTGWRLHHYRFFSSNHFGLVGNIESKPLSILSIHHNPIHMGTLSRSKMMRYYHPKLLFRLSQFSYLFFGRYTMPFHGNSGHPRD